MKNMSVMFYEQDLNSKGLDRSKIDGKKKKIKSLNSPMTKGHPIWEAMLPNTREDN